jgi:hypothetical protein
MFQPGDLIKCSYGAMYIGTWIDDDVSHDGEEPLFGPYSNEYFAIILSCFRDKHDCRIKKVKILIDDKVGWVYEDEIEKIYSLEDENNV